MIHYIEGDIFSSPAQVIVNTVNTVGVMGKGVALAFKNKYPKMFEAYRNACDKKQLTVGKLMLWYDVDYWVLLFPTKINWRNPSKLEYIEEGLKKFVSIYEERRIRSIAFPKLGCGNGGLDWNDVRPLMEKYLKNLPIDIYIYTSSLMPEVPEHKNQKNISAWMKSNAIDMSFSGIKDEFFVKKGMMSGYEFSYEGKLFYVEWNDLLSVYTKEYKEIYKFSEDDVYEIWTDIRKEGVFRLSGERRMNIIYAFIFSLGYLAEINIKYCDGQRVRGYQVREGSGRNFLAEVAKC